MARISRLLDEKVVTTATMALERLGHYGTLSVKLQAVISASKHGITKVSQLFNIQKATLIAWIKNVKNNEVNKLEIQPGRGRKSLLGEEHHEAIRQWVAGDPQMTIAKIQARVFEQWGMTIGKTTAYKALKRLNFSYILKKVLNETPGNTVFCMDEARFGTHSKIGRGWFARGKRSRIISEAWF
jgi:transposase